MNRILNMDCRDAMRQLIAEGVRVQCCVTSPPYWGLRDYGHPGQLGLERTYPEFIASMVEVFGLVRELLADDGVMWLNLGDSYAGGGGHSPNAPSSAYSKSGLYGDALKSGGIKPAGGIKSKDLCGIPWRVAFALQDAGWYLRQDIIWSKPNPMPESVTDRCTNAHEYVFLMSKSARYYYDAGAIREPFASGYSADAIAKAGGAGGERPEGDNFNKAARKTTGATTPRTRAERAALLNPAGRNRRSVWTIATQPYKGAHFATFPEALVEPCILAGSRPGDIVFDPFMGSGTVASVAQRLGRRWLGSELNSDYVKLIEERTRGTLGLELSA